MRCILAIPRAPGLAKGYTARGMVDDSRRRSRPRALAALACAAAVLSAPACSLRKMAIRSIAGSLASAGDVFASDGDPELVRDATPFALKTIEGLLAELPEDRGLLLSAARGFTQYAYAFVQLDAERVARDDLAEGRRIEERALGLYLRARDYGLRGLEVKHPGIGETLRRDPAAAVSVAGIDDVPLLYWTAAAWGAAISLGKSRPEILADAAAIRPLMERALELDGDFDDGAIHEALIVLESLPQIMGGSVERAREHYDQAVVLSRGLRASAHVTFAENVCVAAQDRAAFETALRRALAIDVEALPSARLANVIAKRRARDLLDREDELFFEEIP